MITIDVCWINGLDEQNLNVAKCILKLKQVRALSGSDVWIRINPNYIRILEQAKLIQKNDENKSFVQLTSKGNKIQIFNDTIQLSLEEFFIHEHEIEKLIETSLNISIPKTSYKIMHDTCHSCSKTKSHLTHIVDKNKNDGMYCSQCLNSLGYVKSHQNANNRRKEARNALSIRQN